MVVFDELVTTYSPFLRSKKSFKSQRNRKVSPAQEFVEVYKHQADEGNDLCFRLAATACVNGPCFPPAYQFETCAKPLKVPCWWVGMDRKCLEVLFPHQSGSGTQHSLRAL